MIDDLQAKFLPQLLGLARSRVSRALEVAAIGDYDGLPATVRELHALAGEAGLLGLAVLVPLARRCEDHARQLHQSRTEADTAALVAALHELHRAIELVEIKQPRGGTP